MENNINTEKTKMFLTFSILGSMGLLFLSSFFSACKSTTKSKINILDSVIVINNSGTIHEDWYNKERMYVAVDGEILNRSLVCSYKDFVVEVSFFSSTNTLVTTRTDTLYESISPLEKKKIRKRIEDDFPLKYNNYYLKWKLLDAVQYIPESK